MDELKYKQLYKNYKKKYLRLKYSHHNGGMAGIAQRSVGRHLSKMAAEATAKQASKQFAKQGENSVKRVINNMKKVPKTRVSQPRNLSKNVKDIASGFGTTSLGLAANPFTFMGAAAYHQNYRHNHNYLVDKNTSNLKDNYESDDSNDSDDSDDSDLVGNLSNNDYLSQSNLPYISSAEESY